MKTTHLLVALNLLVFAMMVALGGGGELRHFSDETLLKVGSLYAPLVRRGEWWRLLTATFMHIDPLHLAMNMVALWQVGTVLEPHYGRGRFVGLYLAAGLAGSAVSLAWSWRDPVSSAGASGAISGLIAAGAVAGHFIGTTQARLFCRQMLVWAGIVLVYGAITQADNAAHAGGLVAGAAVAWALDGGGGVARRQGARAGVGLGGVLLVVAVGGAFALAARHQDRAFSVERLINDGVELARAGKEAEAIAKYREALALDGRRPIGHYDLALALLQVGDFGGAEQHAREAVALDGRHRESWWVLSEALTRLGRAADARQAFERYLALGGTRTPPSLDGGKAGAGGSANAGVSGDGDGSGDANEGEALAEEAVPEDERR